MSMAETLAARTEALVQAETDVAVADYMLLARETGIVPSNLWQFSDTGLRGVIEGSIRRGFIEGVAFAVRETNVVSDAIGEAKA